MRAIHDEDIYGLEVDGETRCLHYRSVLDIIAIKFKCCGRWFPCFECHTAIADHDAEVWQENERGAKAILCGRCRGKLSIAEYFVCESTCPHCGRGFNPGCANHYHLYFAI